MPGKAGQVRACFGIPGQKEAADLCPDVAVSGRFSIIRVALVAGAENPRPAPAVLMGQARHHVILTHEPPVLDHALVEAVHEGVVPSPGTPKGVERDFAMGRLVVGIPVAVGNREVAGTDGREGAAHAVADAEHGEVLLVLGFEELENSRVHLVVRLEETRVNLAGRGVDDQGVAGGKGEGPRGRPALHVALRPRR